MINNSIFNQSKFERQTLIDSLKWNPSGSVV